MIRGFQTDFGLITAVGRIGENLEYGYSGHLIINGPKILFPLDFYLGMSCQQKKMTEETGLFLFPVFLSGIINLNPLVFLGRVVPYVRFGMGAVFESVKTAYHGSSSNWDPGLLFAMGLSKPLGKKFSLLLEFNYMFVYQKHLDRAEHNGNFMSLSLGMAYMFKAAR